MLEIKREAAELKLQSNYEQIQTLSIKVLHAYEEERIRLARELHDELGMALTTLKLNLQLTPAASAIGIYNKLTYREKEVFNLLLKSYSRSLIAETLNISPKTVDRHRANLLDKLKLCKETEILQFVKLIGLNEP